METATRKSDRRIFGSERLRSQLGKRQLCVFPAGPWRRNLRGAPSYAVSSNGSETGPSFALANLNANSTPDLITTTNVTSKLSLYTLIGNGNGGFTPGATVPIDETNALGTPPLVAAGDLTGDNDNDAIVGVTTQSQPGAAELAVFLGNGNDTFGSEKNTRVASTVGAMVLGDFNNDKKLDVIAGGVVSTDTDEDPTAGAVFFFAGQGNGSFATPVTIANPLNPVAFAAQDLNGDNNLDLVIANGGSPDSTPPVAGSVQSIRATEPELPNAESARRSGLPAGGRHRRR